MTIARWLFVVAASLAGGALAIGFGLSDRTWLAALPCLVTPAWLFGRRIRIGSPALIAFVVLAGLGALIGVSSGWLLVGIASALAAWDLDHLLHRLGDAAHVENQDRFVAAHLRRLGAAIGAGVAIGLMALGAQFQLDFGGALALAALATISIAQAVRFLLREGN